MWTSPTSLPNGSFSGFCMNVRPPSSDRATWLPLACHATYTVPSERSTATEGSVAFFWEEGETGLEKPMIPAVGQEGVANKTESNLRRTPQSPPQNQSNTGSCLKHRPGATSGHTFT